MKRQYYIFLTKKRYRSNDETTFSEILVSIIYFPSFFLINSDYLKNYIYIYRQISEKIIFNVQTVKRKTHDTMKKWIPYFLLI